MFCMGLVSVVMIEYEGSRAPALRFFPIGLEIVPYLSLLALGTAWRMTSKTGLAD